MKFSLKAQTRSDVIAHLVLIIGLAALLLLGFFYLYLPLTTNHGQTITVPDLNGMRVTEIEDFLAQSDLDYFIEDSSYTPGAKPLTVFSQYPQAGAKVKNGRKIYLSIYASTPPMVKMPNLLGRSLMNAQSELESYGLLLGEVEYVPDLQQNAVLKQLYRRQTIAEGGRVPKGSRIDLVVGDGLGTQEFDVPDLKGKPLDEAEVELSGNGLQVGAIVYDEASTEAPGTILRQKPEAGNKIRTGDVVDVWVAEAKPEEE